MTNPQPTVHEQAPDPAEYHTLHDPSFLDGLAPVKQGVQLNIVEFGADSTPERAADVLTLVAGSGSGVDEAGRTLPYERDEDITAVRIVDISTTPITAYVPDQDGTGDFFLARLNLGIFTSVVQEIDGEERRVASFEPLVPDVRYPMQTPQGVLVGDFGLEGDDYDGHTLTIRRFDTVESDDAHLRAIGEGQSRDYCRRPAVQAVETDDEPTVDGDVQFREELADEGGLPVVATVIEPGVLGTAEDGETGATVVYLLEHSVRIPYGSSLRQERRAAVLLESEHHSRLRVARGAGTSAMRSRRLG